MKILYISNSVIPSRTANSIHVMKICQAFSDNGHDVVLLAPNKYKEYEKGVSDVYEYYGVKNNFLIKKLKYPDIKGRSAFYALRIFFFLIFSKKFDLVYGRHLIGCYLSTLLKNKVIFESHSPIFENKNSQLDVFNKLVQSPYLEKLVVISESLKKMYLENNYLTEKKIQVAHDGADEVTDFKTKVDLFGKVNSLNVGYVGHLYKGRGIELIVECAKNLKNVSFHIIGGNDDDIKYWKNEIEKFNIKNMYFYGFVTPKDASSYRNSFDMVLAPYSKQVSVANSGDTSRYMSPLKIFEYMSHKKPIICSDIPVLREVLNNNNSILINYEDLDGWINAINLLHDPDLRALLSNNAFNDFKNYTWKNRGKKLVDKID